MDTKDKALLLMDRWFCHFAGIKRIYPLKGIQERKSIP